MECRVSFRPAAHNAVADRDAYPEHGAARWASSAPEALQAESMAALREAPARLRDFENQAKTDASVVLDLAAGRAALEVCVVRAGLVEAIDAAAASAPAQSAASFSALHAAAPPLAVAAEQSQLCRSESAAAEDLDGVLLAAAARATRQPFLPVSPRFSAQLCARSSVRASVQASVRPSPPELPLPPSAPRRLSLLRPVVAGARPSVPQTHPASCAAIRPGDPRQCSNVMLPVRPGAAIRE